MKPRQGIITDLVYAIGVMKKHKQTKMNIKNAKNDRVKKQKRPITKQKRPIKKQKRPMKMPIENAKNHRAPSSWCFVGGHKPNAFVK